MKHTPGIVIHTKEDGPAFVSLPIFVHMLGLGVATSQTEPLTAMPPPQIDAKGALCEEGFAQLSPDRVFKSCSSLARCVPPLEPQH